ncbi:ATP-dependent sacrificial sulfur transferase LarE [uncultured Clostridium sp.]|uniref:ATP-dependent sacrificial sulfur transferase LarE n=1 Tax=uncultured Clostridium sp. TaxID=59620 RepID=UPI0034585A34
MSETKRNTDRLKQMMDEYAKAPVCLAFSGGVDSSLLLKLACESGRKYGNPVYAVTFNTMLHPACDLDTAKRVADEMGAEHIVIQVDELQMEGMKDNPPERCYLCKKHLFTTLLDFAREKNIVCILDGTNEDDMHVYRPGIRALKELGIISPLALCHITKKEVKELAAELSISVASRPSTPCMATRLPYGEKLDYEILRKIEAGEEYLRTVFRGNVRLRLHRDMVRLELDPDQMTAAVEKRDEVCKKLKELGFCYITLDLEGFRSGSMDLPILEHDWNS